ncbi:MAG TPA: c-type cytochrome [Gemmatimonadaceae bacterium]|nr:c-type cytochrome [Gemmatimonadaceae bacterium]
MPRFGRVAAALGVACLVLAGCRDTQDARGGDAGDVQLPEGSQTVAAATDTTGLPTEGALSRVAIGDLAGIGNNSLDMVVNSPYAGNAGAIAKGHELFVNMNCAGCHGYDLKGGMGPDLTDTYWRYGGAPADIYKSIFEGRPQGMPAWGRAIPASDIWKVVAYIEAQGGAFPGRLADAARQGDLGDMDTSSGSTLKGRQNVH